MCSLDSKSKPLKLRQDNLGYVGGFGDLPLARATLLGEASGSKGATMRSPVFFPALCLGTSVSYTRNQTCQHVWDALRREVIVDRMCRISRVQAFSGARKCREVEGAAFFFRVIWCYFSLLNSLYLFMAVLHMDILRRSDLDRGIGEGFMKRWQSTTSDTWPRARRPWPSFAFKRICSGNLMVPFWSLLFNSNPTYIILLCLSI